MGNVKEKMGQYYHFHVQFRAIVVADTCKCLQDAD